MAAVRLDDQNAEALEKLAWFLATCPDARYRNGPLALQHAKRACELTQRESALHLEALAAAYAEVGNFEEAVRLQTRAVELDKAATTPKRKTRPDSSYTSLAGRTADYPICAQRR